MKHGDPNYSFDASDYCDSCGTSTQHHIAVWHEDETTVHNTRVCNSCGTQLNYYSPVKFFKLVAAGAVTTAILCLAVGINPLNFLI
jgi:MinD superfamily P-loop ATPase